MIYLQAPHELIQATLMLPSPELGDTQNPEVDVVIRNSMNGKLYSYIKTNTRLLLTWDFVLDLGKAIEVEEFIKVYSSHNIRLTDWREYVYIVKLVNLPITFATIAFGERRQVRLQFEGVRVL